MPLGRAVGITPEMLVTSAEEVSRDRSLAFSAFDRALLLDAYLGHAGAATASLTSVGTADSTCFEDLLNLCGCWEPFKG